MPANLPRVKTYLSRALKPRVLNKARFITWLEDLFADDFGKVLAVNLYIDIKTRSLSPASVIDVLDRMATKAPTRTTARNRFYLCVEQECQPSCLCRNPGRPPSLAPGDQYARILPLVSMIDYYLRAALSIAPNAEAEDEVRRKFYGTGARTRLGIVKNTWRGQMNNVWLTSLTLLLKSIEGLPDGEKGNEVRDRFGFFGTDAGTLVYVAYPPDFDDVFIPTSLDAHSGCYFFVSPPPPRPPTWGLTCSLTSAKEGMEERVHLAFDGLSDEYKSEIVGDITQPGTPDVQYLLDEALSRT